MKKTTEFNTQNAPAAIGPYSQAIIIGDKIMTSGQIALDPATGALVGDNIIHQTEQVLKNLKAILEDAGSSLENAIKVTCYLTNMADFPKFNVIYSQYIKAAPARTCVEVSALPKGALVEIDVIAHL